MATLNESIGTKQARKHKAAHRHYPNCLHHATSLQDNDQFSWVTRTGEKKGDEEFQEKRIR